ncbi:MAG: hypothetical protein ACE5JG_04730, partial [Planctomycetota bacterium]
LDVGFEDIGPQRLKNIDKPVRIYRVLPDAETPGRVVVATGTRLRRWKWPESSACRSPSASFACVAGRTGWRRCSWG